MRFNRRIAVLLCAVGLGALLVPGLSYWSEADAGRGVKFFVVEWRLSWDRGTEDLELADGTFRKPLELRIRGRASLDGRDFDKEFELVERDSAPYLEILRTCAMGRLSGTVTDYDTESGKIVGRRLSSLSCRAVLK